MISYFLGFISSFFIFIYRMQVRRRYKGIHNMLLSDHQQNPVRNVYTIFSDFHHIRPLLRKVLGVFCLHDYFCVFSIFVVVYDLVMLSLTKMIGEVVKSKDQVLIMLSQFTSFMFSLSLFAFCFLGTIQ